MIVSFSEPPIDVPVMMLLDNTSYLLDDPSVAEWFDGKVRRYDVQGEINNSQGEFFAPVYKSVTSATNEISCLCCFCCS